MCVWGGGVHLTTFARYVASNDIKISELKDWKGCAQEAVVE